MQPQPPPVQPPPQYQMPPPQPGYGAQPQYPGYGAPPPYPGMPPGVPPPKPQSSKPMIAGILLIIAALMAIGMGGYIIAVGGAVAGMPIGDYMEDEPSVDEDVASEIEAAQDTVATVVIVCGAIFLVFGILALLGGVFAIQRKKWGIALVGSIFALLSIGVFFLGSIFGLIALILIIMSKDEFN